MYSVMEFLIPLSREDLLRPTGGSQFFVSELLPAREIVSRLEGSFGLKSHFTYIRIGQQF